MRPAVELLARYAQYHRDRRNIATHMLGIPMIMLSLAVLLSRPGLQVNEFQVTPAWVVLGAAGSWWLTRGRLAVGLLVTAASVMLTLAGQAVASAGTGSWLGWGIGLFLVGWLIQLLGHYYEGRKPAFLDDLASLLTGPMFVAAEALFAAGRQLDLLREIEHRAGPKMMRDLALPAAR
jgi:uncharacterized membrane protein YGL010W